MKTKDYPAVGLMTTEEMSRKLLNGEVTDNFLEDVSFRLLSLQKIVDEAPEIDEAP